MKDLTSQELRKLPYTSYVESQIQMSVLSVLSLLQQVLGWILAVDCWECRDAGLKYLNTRVLPSY